MSNNESKHTPTPWINRLGMIFGKSKGGCQMKESDFMVAQIRGWGHLQYLGEKKAIAIQEANADYICHCVNSHDTLVEQMDDLLDVCRAWVKLVKRDNIAACDLESDIIVSEIVEMTKAAIAKVEDK